MFLLLPPLWILIATFAFHTRAYRIPNKLILPALLLAFVVSAASADPGLGIPGSPFSVLAAAMVGFSILLPVYIWGGGAGWLKAHTTFAA
jgi:Flp pilus assembly protein protease CpaA